MSIRTSPPPTHRPITLMDVARELNVSAATVSRAISKPHHISADTVRRVREVVERLGYRPNLMAQNLKQGSSHNIYVIIPSLSPLFFEIFRGIERAALESGYSTVVGHTGRDPAREGEYFNQVAGGRADGVLLVSSARALSPELLQLQLPPTVAVLESVEGHNFPSVRVDHIKAAMQATNHLIQLGHRQIAHITGNVLAPMAVQRRKGFIAAMNAAGLKRAEEGCFSGAFTPEAGQAAMEILLARPRRPTAIFAANDEIAVGAISAIRAAGLRVPDDVSVIGYDDQSLGQFYDPPLTTVHVPTFDIGYQAMVKLRCILAHEDYEHDVVLPTHVVNRATTASPKAK